MTLEFSESPSGESLILAEPQSRESRLRDSALLRVRLGQPRACRSGGASDGAPGNSDTVSCILAIRSGRCETDLVNHSHYVGDSESGFRVCILIMASLPWHDGYYSAAV